MSDRCAHISLLFAIVTLDFSKEKVAKIVPVGVGGVTRLDGLFESVLPRGAMEIEQTTRTTNAILAIKDREYLVQARLLSILYYKCNLIGGILVVCFISQSC